jgi:hypothetical protein
MLKVPPTTRALLQHDCSPGDPNVTASTKAIVEVANRHSLKYHMTEGNSCYRGGKPGISNAFASAIWAADYMLRLASLGCAGVNLHGGDSRFVSASLGDHNPGLKVTNGKTPSPNAFYTPIESEKGQSPSPRPIFYGMLLAQQFAGARLLRPELLADSALSAYAAQRDNATLLALINKDLSQSVSVVVGKDNGFKEARVWQLQAPSLDATSGVTLGGASIADDGNWHPNVERLEVRNGQLRIELRPAAAALLFLV